MQWPDGKQYTRRVNTPLRGLLTGVERPQIKYIAAMPAAAPTLEKFSITSWRARRALDAGEHGFAAL
jgi:hypothetical protein